MSALGPKTFTEEYPISIPTSHAFCVCPFGRAINPVFTRKSFVLIAIFIFITFLNISDCYLFGKKLTTFL